MKLIGDGTLVEFGSVVDAVNAKIKSATRNKYPNRVDVFIEGMRLAGMPEV